LEVIFLGFFLKSWTIFTLPQIPKISLLPRGFFAPTLARIMHRTTTMNKAKDRWYEAY